MTTFFLDTSAIAKRYVRETGSTWVRQLVGLTVGNVIVLSELTIIEMASLLARLQRTGRFSSAVERIIFRQFVLHTEKRYLIASLERAVIVGARTVVQRHPLRTLDAFQLASAQEAARLLAEPMIFVSGDQNLYAAAVAEGFTTDDPNAHP